MRFALLWFPLTEAQRRRDFLGQGWPQVIATTQWLAMMSVKRAGGRAPDAQRACDGGIMRGERALKKRPKCCEWSRAGRGCLMQGFNLSFVTTEWSQKVARNLERKSAARLFHAKARRREGCEVECPCEPPSAVRKDGFRFHCEYRIPHQCALKGHFNSMCNTHRIVCEKVPASLKMAENGGKYGLCRHRVYGTRYKDATRLCVYLHG